MLSFIITTNRFTMATIKQGILGGFSKKVGTVVGSSWKGIAVMRSLPLSVSNPRTTAQVENRDSFKAWAQVASELLSTIVKPLWDRDAKYMSGYNEFIQVNKKLSDAGGSNWALTNAVISKGKLGVTALSATPVTSTSMAVSWDTTPTGDYQQSTDEAYIAVIETNNGNFNTTDIKAIGFATGVQRSAGTATITFLSGWLTSGSTQTVFLAFRRADGTMQGDSSATSLQML